MKPKLKIYLKIRGNAFHYKVLHQEERNRANLFTDKEQKVEIRSLLIPAIYYYEDIIHLYLKGTWQEDKIFVLTKQDKIFVLTKQDIFQVHSQDEFKKEYLYHTLSLKEIRSRILKAVKKYNET